VLQGAGAISGVVIALTSDLTRESQRTKAMAIIGSTIGVVFAVSFIIAPFLQARIGVPGIFALTGVLAFAAMAVVAWAVPDAEDQGPARVVKWAAVLGDPELARLNVGIFVLHAVLMALFVVVPFALVGAGLAKQDHWWVYLSTVGAGFFLMLPAIIGPAAAHERRVFLAAVALLTVAIIVLAAGLSTLAGIITALVIFFAAFNVLEAKLPALVSRAAPSRSHRIGDRCLFQRTVPWHFLWGCPGGSDRPACGSHRWYLQPARRPPSYGWSSRGKWANSQ
jgi:MFS family permease